MTNAPDLRGRLESLRQAAHRGADPDDVEAVQAALFATHEPSTAPASGW